MSKQIRSGAVSELAVRQDLIAKGYFVFHPDQSDAPFDVVAYKHGQPLRLIEVRTGRPSKYGLSYNKQLHTTDITEVAVFVPDTGTVHYFPNKPQPPQGVK